MQQYLPQHKIQKTGLAVQAPCSSDSDMLKVATVVQEIMTDFREAVLEKTK
jgi:hypothetical protein